MKRRDFLKVPTLGMFIPGSTRLENIYPYYQSPDTPEAQIAGEAGVQQRIHQDFITYVPGIEYFLLGNGDIQAVIQYSPDRSGERPSSFLGLTLMDPERFARKWSTFLFHPELGFERSMGGVVVDGERFSANPETFKSIQWKYVDAVPVVSLVWIAGRCSIEEEFFVPSEGGMLFRRVNITNQGEQSSDVKVTMALMPNFGLFDDIATDDKQQTVSASGFARMKLLCLEKEVAASGRYYLTVESGKINPTETKQVRFVYGVDGGEEILKKKTIDVVWKLTSSYWSAKSSVTTGNETLDHLYNLSRTGLKAGIARSGKRDSGIWMYNMEWVRDDVMVMLGMLHVGLTEEARTLLVKMLKKSVGHDGRTIESSRWYGFDYTELDQNGELLYGLWAYLCWTGDDVLVKKYWNKIKLAADFPLQDIFRDPTSGLLRNKREYWERQDAFGVEDGFELAYQFWVVLGLEKAVEIAESVGDAKSAQRWRDAAREIKSAMLNDPTFKLIEHGHFIKRRTRDGRWQQYMIPPNRNSMPPGSPIATEEKPECDPDTAEVLPIIFEMVDPKSDLARTTLRWVDQLWNQRWSFGGYSRYNVSSEPDPPAPWPFASLFVARAYAEAEDSEKVWRVINWLNTMNGGKSGSWFERYGPSITPPAPPVAIVGWTWAEVTSLLVHHIIGFRPALDTLVIRPKLLDGINQAKGKFIVRACTVDLAIYRSKDRQFALVNGKEMPLKDRSLVLPHPERGKSIRIEMHV